HLLTCTILHHHFIMERQFRQSAISGKHDRHLGRRSCFGFFHHPARGAHAPAAFGGVVHGESAAVPLRERAAAGEGEAAECAVAGGGRVAEGGLGGERGRLGREAGAVALHGEGEGVAEAPEGGGGARLRGAGAVGGEVVKHAEDERRVHAGRPVGL